MKKKIAIVTRRLIAGGIEKSLISMLRQLDKEKFEVTVFVMGSGGEFEKFIPSWVEIINIYGEENSVKDKILNSIKKLHLIDAAKITYIYYKVSKARPGKEQEDYLNRLVKPSEKEYDIAIAYHVPASYPVIFVAEKLNAKKKIAWIHSDVEVYKNELDNYIKYYESFDRIVCVSKYGKKKFDMQYPYLSNKTEVIYNIVDIDEIIERSNEKIKLEFNSNYINLLTVGRLTEQKGYDLIPYVVRKLKEKRVKFKWYIIGEGELRSKLEEQIISLNLQEDIILLGSLDNPYPYFKNCDMYVQPSRHEGYCITLAEARIFNKPIVTTNFVGALEQITNNETGLVVSFNISELVTAIYKLITNKELRIKFSNNLINEKLDVTTKIDINNFLKKY